MDDLLSWTDSLTTGLIWQDYQHKKFFEHANELYHMIHEDNNKVDIKQEIQFLESYIHEHLQMEEVYMKELEYPDSQNHIQQHEDFILMFERFKAGYSQNSPKLLSLCVELADWFSNHITQTDLALSNFIGKELHAK